MTQDKKCWIQKGKPGSIRQQCTNDAIWYLIEEYDNSIVCQWCEECKQELDNANIYFGFASNEWTRQPVITRKTVETQTTLF